MSFREVKKLREEGNLSRALELAEEDYQNIINGNNSTRIAIDVETGEESPYINPEKLLWAKRSLAWVYYDYLKKYSQPATYERFKDYLIKIKDLHLPEEEKMVFDNCAWQIGSLLFGLQKAEHVNYQIFDELFEIIKEFHFTKPSEAYSFIYKAFHKINQTWGKYLQFADWWDFDNFKPEDYLNEEFNGKKIMSIVEQAYIAYSKKLLSFDPQAEQYPTIKQFTIEKIEAFLKKIDLIIDTNPEYLYIPYYKAKLLLETGNEEDILSAFLPFAKQKKNEFWVWELMAEIFNTEKDKQFACYCKALNLKTPEDFLVKTREKFAELLIEKQMYEEAKVEIQKIIEARKKHGWKLSNQLVNWTNQDWYISASEKKNNQSLYIGHIKKAEEILYKDLQEELIAVEFVNNDKEIINFVANKSLHGFFKYSEFKIKPKIGDVYKVRLEAIGNEGFYKLLTLNDTKVSEVSSFEGIRALEGIISIREGQSFGFLDNVFIDPNLIQKFNLKNQDKISCKAVLSFNKSRKEWGWKAFEIINYN